MTIDLKTLIEHPDLAKAIKLEMPLADLMEFGGEMVKQGIAAGKRQIPLIAPEIYLTSEEMAKTLRISLVTLWQWDKKGITQPLRIGNMKRYKRSDLEKLMTHES